MKSYLVEVNPLQEEIKKFIDHSITSILNEFIKLFQNRSLTLSDEIYLYNNFEMAFSLKYYDSSFIKSFIIKYQNQFPYITYKFYNKINYDSINIISIVEKINIFIVSLTENNLTKIGRFYLGDNYNIDLITNLKYIYKYNCFHCDLIDGNFFDIPSLITISDDYFCLYEKEQNNYKLIFYSHIKNLLKFNKTLDSIVTFNWRKKVAVKKDEYIFCLYSLRIKSEIDEDMDKVMDILIEKIKKIGFKMDINHRKTGVLPNVDVEATENEINRLELQLKNRDNILVFNKLIQNYEKIIEYYSALNDDKYIEYNNKMKDLLSNEKYDKYIK